MRGFLADYKRLINEKEKGGIILEQGTKTSFTIYRAFFKTI